MFEGRLCRLQRHRCATHVAMGLGGEILPSASVLHCCSRCSGPQGAGMPGQQALTPRAQGRHENREDTGTGTTRAQALKPCVSATGTGYVPARTRTFRAQGQSFGFVCRHARGAPGRCLRHLACSWAGRSHANPRHCEWLLAGEVRLGLSIIRGGLQIRLTRNRVAIDQTHRWQAARFSRWLRPIAALLHEVAGLRLWRLSDGCTPKPARAGWRTLICHWLVCASASFQTAFREGKLAKPIWRGNSG